MAAKDALHPQLFHGTGGEIRGGVVKPDASGNNAYGVGAYASNNIQRAEHYAESKAIEQGRLFGTVYEVSPVSKTPTIGDGVEVPSDFVIDKKGLKVGKAVSFPINPEAVYRGPANPDVNPFEFG